MLLVLLNLFNFVLDDSKKFRDHFLGSKFDRYDEKCAITDPRYYNLYDIPIVNPWPNSLPIDSTGC